MPTRFDDDLRATGGTPIVVLTGNTNFVSERVVATEAGFRQTVSRIVSLDLDGFFNDYDRLRTLEPTPPIGFPLVISNNMTATTAGLDASVEAAPVANWRLHAGYSLLSEKFRGNIASGANEHNDPRHQFWLRSFVDLPKRVEADAVLRAVAALPNPPVPGYTELTLRAGWGHGGALELSIVGDNLLHGTHQEFQIGGPPESIERSVYAQVTWRLAE